MNHSQAVFQIAGLRHDHNIRLNDFRRAAKRLAKIFVWFDLDRFGFPADQREILQKVALCERSVRRDRFIPGVSRHRRQASCETTRFANAGAVAETCKLPRRSRNGYDAA